MLFEFLIQHKTEIIQLCREKVLAAGDAKPTSALLDRGLPIFYDELIGVLRRTASAGDDPATCGSGIASGDAAAHGRESLRLGYTISQVVHAYGAVCQAITEFVQAKSHPITAKEFHDLNLCLDCAIAEAVTEFEASRNESVSCDEAERLGSLLHELGSSLAAATIAHVMIQEGQVGSAGVTSRLEAGALERMRHLIHRSLAEVRLRGQATVERTEICLADLVNEVEAAEMLGGNSQEVRMALDVDPSIHLTADYHLVFSALSNLVSNAMRLTRRRGKVSVRGRESAGRILIEVEDECGGLPGGDSERLFSPFVQGGARRSGLGLGLSLSRRAIERNHGALTARNITDSGCVFTIDLPSGEGECSSAVVVG